MAISKMQCLRIIGLTGHLNEAAKVLRNSHNFHPDDPFHFFSDTKQFVPCQITNPYSDIMEKFNNSVAASGIKCQIIPDQEDNLTENDIIKYAEEKSEILAQYSQKQHELEHQINECKHNIEQIKHFLNFDLDLEKIKECRYINVNFGKLPKDSFEKLNNYQDNPFIMFFPCSNDDNYYWGIYISPIANSSDVDRIFSGLYFEKCDLFDLSGTPEQLYTKQQKLLPKLEDELINLKKEYVSFAESEKNNLNICYTFFNQLQEDCALMAKAAIHNNSFVLIGWVPKGNAEDIDKKLSEIESVECTVTDGCEEVRQSPPIKLKNPRLTRGFEFYTEMYGLPNYKEFDPTAFIAITYTILFGIMFGDVGHGLMVLIAGIVMSKKLNMKIGSILIPCGISGTIFGFIYGSVCGFEHVLDPLYKALFGMDEKPISVMEPAMTNNIIYIAVGIGIVLVALAIILNIIVSFKMKDIESAVFGNNGICGLLFYVSLVVGLVCQILLGISILTPVYIICLIVLPLLLIFLREPLGKLVSGKKNWQPEKWGEYCVQNFFELFEVLLSYVTNTMSFLRVGAFVLVHAGMMEVVFTLANMTSGVGYVAIVVFGNLFVMALEALLVCIQVLRLEFYEMFGRFYKGDGRAFTPVNA